MQLRFLAAIAFGCVTVVAEVQAAEWFENQDVNCSGIQVIGDAFAAYTGGSLPIKSGAGQGEYFVELSAGDYSALLTNAADRISNVKTLNKNQAQTLASIIAAAAENAKIPTFVKVGTALATGLILPQGPGTRAGLLFSYLFDKWDAYAVSLKETSLFLVDGGDAYRRTAPLRDQNDAPFVASTTEYRVMVGKETRNFMYHGCIYALSVKVREFATTGQFNNKIVKQIAGKTWRVWDVDDKKFDSADLTYLRQDGGYYYFEADAIEKNVVKGKHQHRISFKGGPWQYKNFFDPAGTFKTQYAKVTAT
jgi:hypothetical protein